MYIHNSSIETLKFIARSKIEFCGEDETITQKELLQGLLNKMLEFSPERRIAPEDILKHSFLSGRELSCICL